MNDAPEVAEAPEFGSVVLTIDHMATNGPEGHTVRKWVTSTQSLAESMLGLFDYYGDAVLLTRESTLELFQEAKAAQFPVFIYHTKENCQVVASCETFTAIVMALGNGSLMLASEELERMAAGIAGTQMEANGAVSPLSVFCFSETDPDVDPVMPEVAAKQVRTRGVPKPQVRTKRLPK